jgi:L-ribulose-5-phosphate 3-epimerase
LTILGVESSSRIGFMQGRLSPIRNGRIQSFPWETWQGEFEIGSRMSLRKIEWTIDTENFISNPLLTPVGRREITRLKSFHKMEIPSITCDFFMENPPWKSDSNQILDGIKSILVGMAEIDSKILVIPLVDNSSLGHSIKTLAVEKFFSPILKLLRDYEIRIAFETDLNPKSFREFINQFDDSFFGINYDIGNSASLGFDPDAEFDSIGGRVINVHVKDRVLGGATVPLGTGDADFPKVFKCLKSHGYMGNLIMQTARATGDNHAEVLGRYREQVICWMDEVK